VGIYVAENGIADIYDVDIRNTKWGIFCDDNTECFINDANIRYGDYGIVFDAVSDGLVENSYIDVDAGYAVGVWYGSTGVGIEDNDLLESDSGTTTVLLDEVSSCSIVNNNIDANNGNGITILDSQYVATNVNDVDATNVGLHLDNCDDSLFYEDDILGTNYGMRIEGTSEDNEFLNAQLRSSGDAIRDDTTSAYRQDLFKYVNAKGSVDFVGWDFLEDMDIADDDFRGGENPSYELFLATNGIRISMSGAGGTELDDVRANCEISSHPTGPNMYLAKDGEECTECYSVSIGPPTTFSIDGLGSSAAYTVETVDQGYWFRTLYSPMVPGGITPFCPYSWGGSCDPIDLCYDETQLEYILRDGGGTPVGTGNIVASVDGSGTIIGSPCSAPGPCTFTYRPESDDTELTVTYTGTDYEVDDDVYDLNVDVGLCTVKVGTWDTEFSQAFAGPFCPGQPGQFNITLLNETSQPATDATGQIVIQTQLDSTVAGSPCDANAKCEFTYYGGYLDDASDDICWEYNGTDYVTTLTCVDVLVEADGCYSNVKLHMIVQATDYYSPTTVSGDLCNDSNDLGEQVNFTILLEDENGDPVSPVDGVIQVGIIGGGTVNGYTLFNVPDCAAPGPCNYQYIVPTSGAEGLERVTISYNGELYTPGIIELQLDVDDAHCGVGPPLATFQHRYLDPETGHFTPSGVGYFCPGASETFQVKFVTSPDGNSITDANGNLFADADIGVAEGALYPASQAIPNGTGCLDANNCWMNLTYYAPSDVIEPVADEFFLDYTGSNYQIAILPYIVAITDQDYCYLYKWSVRDITTLEPIEGVTLATNVPGFGPYTTGENGEIIVSASPQSFVAYFSADGYITRAIEYGPDDINQIHIVYLTPGDSIAYTDLYSPPQNVSAVTGGILNVTYAFMASPFTLLLTLIIFLLAIAIVRHTLYAVIG
jgi:hypothetical protein